MTFKNPFYRSQIITRLLSLVVLTLVLAAVACGGASESTPNSSNGTDLSGLSGDINIDGSSTVFPITEAVAEEFGILTRGNVRVTVGVSGTGGGFQKFCKRETDISNASRPIKASEVRQCQESGVEYLEIPVAIDGLTVMVNPGNDYVQCMTVAELHTVWSPEAEDQVTRWNQVRPEWPDESIDLYAPGVDSGTFDYFTETINGKSQASRGDFTASEDDNVLVQGISGDKGSLGYFGYAYFTENQGLLKPIAIDGGNGCVSPTEETINDGTYTPLSRPLFIYVRQDVAETPHIKQFIEYYLGAEGRGLVSEVGYIPFQARIYDLALGRVSRGMTGTIFGGGSPQEGSVEAILSANQ
ncbi:MAG: PstS family phosphate ABC transporter substrate-binding protein [Dehalococcoidia bacterium]